MTRTKTIPDPKTTDVDPMSSELKLVGMKSSERFAGALIETLALGATPPASLAFPANSASLSDGMKCLFSCSELFSAAAAKSSLILR